MAEYIDKAEALSRFSFYNGDRIPERDVDGFPNTITFHDAKAVIRSIRPADVRPVVRGRWVKQNQDPLDGSFYCSACHEAIDIATGEETPIDRGLFFCPNCGADMRPENDE